MPKTKTAVAVLSTLLTLAMLGAVGCENPATGKTEAVVKEAAGAGETGGEGRRFVISEESTLAFVGSKVTGSHDGGFNSFSGEVMLVDGDPTRSSVNITIDTTSLWADDDRLTGHLKSPDFFDVETYPTATFRSTSITAAENGYTVAGDLELHGVTKNVSFPASIEVSGDTVRAEAEFFIKRFDFGIVYPGKPDNLIRDEVVIKLQIQAGPETT